MHNIFGELKSSKLKIINYSKILIENYQIIKEINKDLIMIDNYVIMGKNLTVISMDLYTIVIEGKVIGIEIKK